MTSFSTTQQIHPVSLASVATAPLAGRPELLTRLFAESTLKELAALYPVLLEDVFGFGGRPGWNVHLVTRKCHPREFDQLRGLLQPAGPLFSVMYRLMADPHVAYEFPTACLPASAAGAASLSMTAGQWSMLSPPTIGGAPTWGQSVMLSPLELYLHHFCFFLLSLAQQGAQIAWAAAGDALYPTLLDDLMTYFLPCGPQWVPPLNTPAGYHHHHPPISMTPETMTPETRRLSTPPRLLLRTSLLRQGAELRPPATPAQHDFLTPASILYELDTHVPSHDQMRVVRMLVKHMHLFTNSPHHLAGLEDFKRQAQAMLQKRLYGFLRHAFKHWPTDMSLRLVLETWLSYIQPWRYTDYTVKGRSPGQNQKESDKHVEPAWGRFVADNLLFYSAIFRQLLPRFHRMDLTVPRYAHMVHRLARVMCQPGLSKLIHEAEALLGENRWASRHAANSDASLLYAASVGQHIIDLEEAGFAYQPMFDAACRQQVQTLLSLLSEARRVVQQTLTSLPASAGSSGSLWASLLGALGARSAELTCGEFSPDDMRRGANHLDEAIRQLAALYELGRQQLISGLCRADVQYQGDPERRPVQSTESATLLRALQALAAHVNQTYGPTLAALYARDDYAGYLARQVIQPPATFYHFVRVSDRSSARQAVHRPAAVSLRRLAD
ncbi:sphingomyelin phosphodiesterase 4-like, partial [Pollicipes pollicipes]|uniref:sphingomyelin phosphodiesterase 4-like n=1 Tax=Pollicipes pollicipes TaxID=41117 RepID=UPI001884AFBC